MKQALLCSSTIQGGRKRRAAGHVGDNAVQTLVGEISLFVTLGVLVTVMPFLSD
jgi:hypothetical protein